MRLLLVTSGNRPAASPRTVPWGNGLAVALEKHGYGGVREAGPEALDDPGQVAAADVVLVTEQAHDVWTADRCATVLDAPVPVIAEGPLPPELCRGLGVAAEDA